MAQRRLPAVLLLASVFAAGCEHTETPTEVTSTPLFARPVQESTDSRANWVWHATMTYNSPKTGNNAAQIFGDGKDKNGNPVTGDSEYQGDLCGVRAIIQAPDNSGDAPFDPDYTVSESCPRKILFDLDANASTEATPTVADARAYRINRVEDTRPRFMMLFNVPIENCTQLRYGVLNTAEKTLDKQIISTDTTTGVVVTRTGTNPGKWTVETVNGGKAQCYNSYKGGWAPTGPEVYLPFRITITEIR